jgi:uncharacterized protein (TIGR01777 family)
VDPDEIGEKLMQIAVTGASGMVGRALTLSLRDSGHDVVALSRRRTAGGVVWNPGRRELNGAALAGVDAVVHLAGESIAGGRWTPDRKTRLRESRVPVTRWLAERLTRLVPRPRVLISVSAVGIYGSRGDELLNERSSHGSDFLATLASDWEAAADPAREAGIRVVHPRLGVVLSPIGGALRRMTPAFRLGLGGPVGSGRQWLSWIAIDDLCGAVQHALGNEALAGPVNFTAPHPVRNADFARALGGALHRPAIIPLPAFALRLAFGEMAEATLLASQRVSSARLVASGFQFRFPELGGALQHMLKSRQRKPA